jgi:hypothetical protein
MIRATARKKPIPGRMSLAQTTESAGADMFLELLVLWEAQRQSGRQFPP